MSKGYIIGGGGSTKLYACISVTYPSGSTCTCTNGTKTLKAKGTSGTAIFNVPSTGTWTVTATNGSKTASKSVSITAEGQTVVVDLKYETYLLDGSTMAYTFAAGAQEANKNTGTNGSVGTVTKSSDGIRLTGSWEGVWATQKVVDLTDFNSLVFNMTKTTMSGWGGYVGVFDATGYWDGGQIAAITTAGGITTGLNTIDISSVTGVHRVGIAWYGTLDVTFKQIYLL